ncbi:amidase [Acidobacteria bacterium AH-259-G07]|nr:amidase [Acidobacteria bacterium AH-259-G07]
MADETLVFSGISDIATRIASGDLSPVEVVDVVLARIEQLNPQLNAYIAVIDSARHEAQAAQEALATKKKLGPLHGVPLSIKDIILTRGTLTTAGSKIFGTGSAANRDALLVGRLRRAGAIVVGKTNLHECAFGVTNENSHFGAVRNPWDLRRIPGGSSGGSAAAVAAGLCYGSIGSDTRGSIRIPSACCAITGLKPTLDLVPMKGVIPLSWTLDHVGPMTRSVEDAARLLEVLAQRSTNYLKALRLPIHSLRLGVCEYYFRDLDPEVELAVQGAVQVFRDAGLQVQQISVNHLAEALTASDIIARAEAVTYHDRFLREQRESYGSAVRERLETGYSVTGMEYVQAERVRIEMIEEFKKVFKKVDCLIGAALPALPPPVGQNFIRINGREEHIVPGFVRFNAPQNVAGIPALGLPCGFSQSGLPIGFQLIAGRHQEHILFQLGAHFQRVTDWHLRHPAATPLKTW